jgi:hypothetical protein
MCKRCQRCGYKFCFKHKYNEDASGHDCKGFKLFKKEEILKEVNHWVELAEKNEASYNGLVNDHNYNWAN